MHARTHSRTYARRHSYTHVLFQGNPNKRNTTTKKKEKGSKWSKTEQKQTRSRTNATATTTVKRPKRPKLKTKPKHLNTPNNSRAATIRKPQKESHPKKEQMSSVANWCA